jgi:hypothetical protein
MVKGKFIPGAYLAVYHEEAWESGGVVLPILDFVN